MAEHGAGVPDSANGTGFRRVSVPHLFREIAREHADGIALIGDDQRITYRELDAASNRIAHALLARNRPGRPFAAVAGLDIASASVLLGAVKAGQPFVPLDIRESPQQWLSVFSDTGALLAVPDETTRAAVRSFAPPVDFVTFGELAAEEDDDDPSLDLDPDACAFVFFTAGSTGRPKGTMVGHTLQLRWLDTFARGAGDRLTLMAPLVFTGGTGAVLATILSGATGCFFDLLRRDPMGIFDWMDEVGITLLTTVPSALRSAGSIVEPGRVIPSVRLVVLASEPCTAGDLGTARHLFPNARFANCYGSSEAGAVARYEVGADGAAEEGALPVGRPFPWQHVEIVDEAGEPVTPGEVGEIVVTGEDVALGYWDDPILTGLRFEQKADGRRVVRTGDLGRLRPDGLLEYLGRLDFRVKIRGQLVDPLAVEYELRTLPEIEDAVVSSVEARDGSHRLVAHVVTTPGARVTASRLRRALSARLASYMVPSAFFGVREIPKTISGKADRAGLRKVAGTALPREVEHVAPRTDVERVLAALFAEVLGVEHVGVADDFFELGGDSLSALELLAGISERLGSELSPAELLEHPTVAALTERLSPGHEPSSPTRTLVRVTSGGPGLPFFCVPGAGAKTVFLLRPLARRLAGRSTYGFVPHGAYTRGLPDRSVRRLASRYVAALREVDADGPYLVGGHSFGGAVAHEMACQLEAAGAEVALLVLLEPAVAIDELGLRGSVVRRVNEARQADPGSAVAARARRASTLLASARRRTTRTLRRIATGVVLHDPEEQHALFQHLHGRASRRHRPGRFSGPTLVVRTSRFDELPQLPPNVASSEFVVGERRVVDVPGEHSTMLAEPHVATVATAIEDALVLVDLPAGQTGDGASASRRHTQRVNAAAHDQ